MKTRVRYNCPGCGIKAKEVLVPARPQNSPVTRQAIEEWVKQTVIWCAKDHLTVSPMCGYGKLDLMIPTMHPDGTDKEWLGQEDKGGPV